MIDKNKDIHKKDMSGCEQIARDNFITYICSCGKYLMDKRLKKKGNKYRG